MIRALWYFFIVAVLAALTAAIAGVPGDIVATVGDRQIAMSVATALGLVAVLVGLAIFAERIISFVMHGPGNAGVFWRWHQAMPSPLAAMRTRLTSCLNNLP